MNKGLSGSLVHPGSKVAGGRASVVVEDLLDRCGFPEKGSAITCAVSGGADSLALMMLAHAWGCEVTAIHVDHCLRDGSSDEADVVADAARDLGVCFVSRRVEVPAGPNLEARARAARYSVLPPDVATGHTADDQAETVLLNLLRGSGIDGLAAMRAGPRHPLLALRRSETVALCESMGLEPVQDPSNDDPSWTRNRVRHELMPLCASIARRDVVKVIARQSSVLAEEAAFLDSQARAVDPTDARAVAQVPHVLARRTIRIWLRDALADGHPPSLAAVERVLKVARGEASAAEVSSGIRVRRSHWRLFIEHSLPAASQGVARATLNSSASAVDSEAVAG